MIYIYYGDNEYLIQKDISDQIGQSELVEIDFDLINMSELFAMMASQDLFATKKTYLFTNIDLFQVQKNKYNKINKIWINKIFNLDVDIIIMNTKKINKKAQIYHDHHHQIVYKEYLQKSINFKTQTKKYISDQGIKIDQESLGILNDNFNEDMPGFMNEVEKLIQFTNYQMINKNDIDQIGVTTTETKIFQLYNFIFQKKQVNAVNYLNQLVSNDEDIDVLLLIGFKQLQKYHLVKQLSSKSLPSMKIASLIEINSYQVTIIEKELVNCDLLHLSKLVVEASNLDLLYKSGQIKSYDALIKLIFL